MSEAKIEFSSFLGLKSTSFNEGKCKSDGFVCVYEPKSIIFVENASLIFIHTYNQVIYIDNKGKKTLVLEGNILSGLSDNATIMHNNVLLHVENANLVLNGLAEANNQYRSEHHESRDIIKGLLMETSGKNFKMFKPAPNFKNPEACKHYLERPLRSYPMRED